MGNNFGLYQSFNLIELKFNIGFSAEHRNLSTDFLLIHLDFGNNTDKSFKGTVLNSDIIALCEVKLYGLVCGAVSMIMMLVFSFNKPQMYVDHRPISVARLTDIQYTELAAVLTICAIAFVVFSLITIFVNDYAEVLESDGAKKPLVKRFVSFIREYKSEIKKIRWPDFKTVLKNTIIVLIVCAVVGAFIWVLDFGLGNLIKWLFA